MVTDTGMSVTVVYSPQAREVLEVTLVLEHGATVGQAILATGWFSDLAQLKAQSLETGIWGRKVPLSHVLQANDRAELYRPLRVDPKKARRERFSRQGAKSAGLFAKRRSGAKAGY
jgi:putative ubiquitin-RnfH superfamily antitoxin RatB of RatAB toxin-antitoxin module